MRLKNTQRAALTLCWIGAMLAIPSVSFAAGQVVKCAVESEGQSTFRGKCVFFRENGGSFTLRSANPSRTLLEGITDVSVYIVGKDMADVRGLTTDGINSRWGEAKRSKTDKACWVGSDFKVCA